MKKIMILGASILQLPAIKKAKKMGLQVIAVDINPNAVGFKESDVICEVISTIDIPKVLEAAKRHKIDGIMTLASDMPMRTVAIVAKELNLVGISEDCAVNVTNKAEMRRCLYNHDVPSPEFYKVSDKNDFLRVVNIFKRKHIKCIVKPADNSGSRGINLLEDYSEKSILKTYEYSKKFSRNGDILVEEYMEGPEVSVETISINNICHVIQITDKLTTGAPYFVEMGHSQPSELSKKTIEKVADVAVAAIKAVGITEGPSHTEIKVTKHGPKIVELGARLGGDNITTHLVPLSTGIDMVRCCIDIALGRIPDIRPIKNHGAAIRFFLTRKGFINSITGMDEATNIKNLEQIEILAEVGERINDIKSSIDRVGYVICSGENSCEAIKNCERAMNIISINIGDLYE